MTGKRTSAPRRPIGMRLRIYFRFERRLLGQVRRAAARTVTTVSIARDQLPAADPRYPYSDR
jgi:hypothetical protein